MSPEMSPEAAFEARPAREQLALLEQLARRALAAFGLPPNGGVRPLAYGENCAFRVTADGSAFVLKVHRPGYQTADAIRSEAAWVQALREADVLTPPTVLSLARDPVVEASVPGVPGPRLCTLRKWVEGEPLGNEDIRRLARELGRIASRLHAHGAVWPRPPGFVRPSWDGEGLVGPQAVWSGSLARLEEPADRRLFALALERARPRVLAMAQTPDRFGLIHADLHGDNVLLTAEGPCVFDFDDCGPGWFLYDLATTLAELDPSDHAAVVELWLAEHNETLPLAPDALADLSHLVMARHLGAVSWLESRGDAPVAAELRAPILAAARAYAFHYLATAGDARPWDVG